MDNTSFMKAALWRFRQRHRQAVIIVVVIAAIALAYFGGYLTGRPLVADKTQDAETGAQIASQVTVLCPSYLTYAQQTALERGTGLTGVDFIFVERQTGIDALTLLAIAAHESGWGSNYWAVTCNNVMSFGVSDSDPDRTRYASKTYNVLVTAQYLKRAYLTAGGTYYHGSATLWGINYYYCPGSRRSLAWASGINTIIQECEHKLTYEQRMKRWAVRTQLYALPVTWDYEHLVTGYALYKANNSAVIAGR